MLMSEFQHNIDKKGRVFIPAKLREDLGDRFVISKSLDSSPCLFIYSMEEWQKLVDKLNEQPFVKARKLQRYLFSGAAELEPDAQGRVLLPQTLREFAQLMDSASATIIGASNRIEIWSSENWIKENEDVSQEEILNILEDCNL
ncbi:MAG: division/cell wall cluster transcriptional repressor MraZ [Clostridia bacterium]|nr:division/cell wall cluster transcriptional repressor MraZ [Clostridia bacterium]